MEEERIRQEELRLAREQEEAELAAQQLAEVEETERKLLEIQRK